MGTQPPPLKGGGAPNFWPVSIAAKLLACMKMPLGTEVGLGPDDIVLDRDPATPSPKRSTDLFPIFGPCLLWQNGWMDKYDTWHGGGPWSRPHCARWEPSCHPLKGDRAPNFRPIFIVAKRLDGLRCHLVREYTSAQATLY